MSFQEDKTAQLFVCSFVFCHFFSPQFTLEDCFTYAKIILDPPNIKMIRGQLKKKSFNNMKG